MEIEIIKNGAELTKVEPYQIEYLLWGTTHIPKTYAYLGFVPEDGFYLKMVCEEKDPLRTYTKDHEPVYRDSAMEAFFQFDTNRGHDAPPTYLNFEANANGALLAAYGTGRTYRTSFSKEEMRSFDCKAEILEDRWQVELKIPVAILRKIYGSLNLGAGSKFRCNFYKISETSEIEHYASCFPIKTEVVSFHLPEYFEEMKLVERESGE